MKDCSLGDILCLIFIVVTVSVGGYYGVGEIKRNPDEIVKETTDSIYVKTYTLYNKDSETIVYPQPKIYTGKVVDQHKQVYYVGTPGKSKHRQIRYTTTIEYGGKTTSFYGIDVYDRFNRGSIVKVKESLYPCNKVEILE